MRLNQSEITGGVVIDEPLARAFLYQAVSEGLLDNNQMIGDGYVKRIMSQKPENELIVMAYEQLMIGNKLYAPMIIPDDWKGELFEKKILEPLGQIPDEELIEINQIDHDLMRNMLRTRNVHWSNKEINDRYINYCDAYKRWEQISDGKPFGNLKLQKVILEAVGSRLEGYTKEQIDAWDELQQQYRELAPVINCWESYKRVLTGAMMHDALSAVPLSLNQTGLMDISNATDSGRHLKLMKLTCDEMQRFPVGRTLKETIALAGTPEIMALRIKLTEWAQHMASNEIDDAEFVRKEVTHARKQLAVSSTASGIGRIITVIGVPLSVAGMISPIVGGIGVAISGIGLITLATEMQFKKINRWAMFG